MNRRQFLLTVPASAAVILTPGLLMPVRALATKRFAFVDISPFDITQRYEDCVTYSDEMMEFIRNGTKIIAPKYLQDQVEVGSNPLVLNGDNDVLHSGAIYWKNSPVKDPSFRNQYVGFKGDPDPEFEAAMRGHLVIKSA